MDYRQAARENVDRYIGDTITSEVLMDSEEGVAEFYDNVYVLAHDGAVAAGATMEEARWAADHVVGEY